jgi:hypothetical protein
LEAGLKAKNASVWCIGGAEVAAELDAKRAIDQGAVFFRARACADLLIGLSWNWTDEFYRLTFGCSSLKPTFSNKL